MTTKLAEDMERRRMIAAATETEADVEKLAAPAVARSKKHHGGWKNQGCAVLPIGKVNLKTGKNEMFGFVWSGWEQSEKASNILVSTQDGSVKFKAIHTSGSAAESALAYAAGDTMTLAHDQTGRRMGWVWTVVGIVPHTPEGLLKLKALCNQTSVNFCCFK